MLKSPIARLPAILLDFINRLSGETDCIYEAKVKWTSTRPSLISTHVNSKYEWRKWPLKLISACFLMLFCLACNSVPGNGPICVNKGHTYLDSSMAERLSMQICEMCISWRCSLIERIAFLSKLDTLNLQQHLQAWFQEGKCRLSAGYHCILSFTCV